MANRGTLSLIQKFSFGTGHILNDLCASVWFSYLLVYLQFVLEIPSGLSGIILLIGQVADAFATPLIGLLSDHGRCCCAAGQAICDYGRRKIWHLIGSVCVIISFPLMFAGCWGLCESTNGAGYLAILIFFVCVFQFGWAAAQISHLAMIPELTPVESERDELNIIRFAFDIVTDILVYCIALLIFTQGSQTLAQVNPENTKEFKVLAGSITLIGLVFTIIFHAGIKENPVPTDREDSPGKKTLKSQWLGWFTNWQFYRVGILYTSSRLAHNLSIVFVPLYLQETKQASQMLALIPLVMNVAGLIGSGILKFTIQFLGKKASYVFSSMMGIGSCVWLIIDSNRNAGIPLDELILTGSSTNGYEFYLLSAFMGGSAAMVVILSLTSAADLIDDNTETSAFVYGCMSFCDKMASGIMVALIQGLHSWVCSEEECTNFYGQVLIYGVGIPFVIVIASSICAPKTSQQLALEQNSKKTDINYGSFKGHGSSKDVVF